MCPVSPALHKKQAAGQALPLLSVKKGKYYMWKIFIAYDDKSKITITGKQKDIPLRLALKYYREYINGKNCTQSSYQRYPKKNYPVMNLMDKIEALAKE